MKIDPANLERQELHDLVSNTIAPLPVVLISTIAPDGTHNAAPFSFVAPVCSKPPIICISIGLRQGKTKDTLRNIEFTHDFVVNVVDETLINQAVQASKDYPYDIDEIREVGLTAVNSEKIKSPRVAESKVNLECRLVQKLEILETLREGQGLRSIIFGEVVLAHVKDEVWVGGKVDPFRLKAVGRMGKDTYCKTGDIIRITP